MIEKSISEEIKELEKKSRKNKRMIDMAVIVCPNCKGAYKLDAHDYVKKGKLEALKSAAKRFEDVLDEIDFTNLLRQQDCINVNFVIYKIKEEIKSKLGVAG
jgi:uncharacterized protein YbaR (Trm112 family)